MTGGSRATLGAILPLAIMLLLAMLTLWLERTVELTTAVAPRTVTHEPDYVVEKFNLQRLSADGEPRYRLSAARMVHFPDDDSSHLTEPRLIQTSPGKVETRASALRGVVSSDGREVKLYEQVELFRAGAVSSTPGGRSDDLRVRTGYLRVIPDDDKADTTDRVLIEQGASTLNGTGMTYDNRYRRFALLAAVRGTMERKK